MKKAGLHFFIWFSALFVLSPTHLCDLYGQELVHQAQPYLSSLLRKAEADRLWSLRGWQTLLHYEKTVTGWESEIDSPSFFISADGKSDPKEELFATLNAFFQPVGERGDSAHATCQFIARYEWLQRQLAIDAQQLPSSDCSSFKRWYQEVDARSVWLIFADYYIQSSASVFGHTLLRIDSSRTKSAALLGNAVNYSAIVDYDETGPFSLVFRGVFGGFKGAFTTYPYYQAVQGYNDIESRDIWEYELKLTDEEISRMMKHLWELKIAQFDYFFFKENCSYHLLSLLEVARPSLQLKRSFTYWTVPVDTIKQVAMVPDLVGQKIYRPSLWRKIHGQVNRLQSEDQALFLEMINVGSL